MALLLAFGAAIPSPCRAGPAHNDSMPTILQLNRIEFKGLARFSPDQILKTAGLHVGQTLTDVDVRAISSRLLDTGFFKRAGSRYLITGTRIDITFEVEEASFDVPVLYDNFVWFTDEELTAAVAGKVPAFDGKAPRTGGVPKRITGALQGLLAARGLPGKVEHHASFNERGGEMKHVFAVEGVDVPVCRFLFPGADSGRESELREGAKVLIGAPYSRNQIVRFTRLTLLPLLLQHGYLRARFGDPLATRESGPGCDNGVAIALPVEQGEVHSWDGAKWTGNVTLPAAELDSLLGMKRGEVADGRKMEEGLAAVKKAYGTRGFLDLALDPVPQIAAGEARALYEIRINEGPRYRMGTFTLTGLPQRVTDQVTKKWSLVPGAVFDASYPAEFVRNAVADPRVISNGSSIQISVSPDRQQHVVDVTISVTSAASPHT